MQLSIYMIKFLNSTIKWKYQIILDISLLAHIFADCIVTYVYIQVYRQVEEFTESPRKGGDLTDVEQILCSRDFARYCPISSLSS